MMRKIFLLFLLSPLVSLAQKPFISGISPTHIEIGRNINISGSNLGNVDEVYFGGVKGTIVSAANNLVVATVPAGATNSTLRVHTTTNLAAESSEHFFISFGGNAVPTFGTEFNISVTELDAYDICLCDLNNDGQNDVIISHNFKSGIGSEASILINQSTPSTKSFREIMFVDNPINTDGFISTTCADLDNDGDNDVVFTTNEGTNSQHILFYENEYSGPGASTLTFDNDVQLILPDDDEGNNRIPRRVKTADIDGNGKLDLVVGNENDATIHIFPNTSLPDNFSFGTAIEVPVGTAATTGALDIGDFNNDGKPDIVVVPAAQSSQPIFILKNQSLAGNISFELEAGISPADQRRNVVIGDFDNDGLNDIATTVDRTITSVSGSEIVEIFRNTTAGSDITFTNATNITIPGNLPWGLDAGDLNGDGLLDLAVACVGGNVYTIQNTTTGAISFAPPVEQTTTSNTRNICIGDLNQDARPDLAYTHNVSLSQVGDLGIQLNETCIVPTITPNNLEFCVNDPFTLNATNSTGTYLWEITTLNGTNPLDTTSTADVTITSGTSATVRVTLTLGGCSEQGTADFTLVGGTQPAPPTFGVDQLICSGDNYKITASGGPFAEYEWTRPSGSTVVTTTETLDITSATLADAGSYTVRARPTSGCYSEESVAFDLAVSQPPPLEITNSGLDDFCAGSNVSLSVSGFTGDGFSYQWQLNGTSLETVDEKNASLTVNQEGNYTVKVTDVNTCVTETARYFINSVEEPTSIITGPTETCTNFETTFNAVSTGEIGFTLEYAWLVDGNPVTPANPSILNTTFTTAGPHTVTLTTGYDNEQVASCSNETVFNVNVSAPPTIAFSTADRIEKCQAETAPVGVQNTGIDTYSWSIRNAAAAPNDTIISVGVGASSLLNVFMPKEVDSVYAIATINTTIGCTVLDSVKVVNFPSEVDIELPNGTVRDTVILDKDNFTSLTALNVTNVRWRPNDIMSDSTSQTVTVFPGQRSTFVTLLGTDNNGCAVSSKIEIILDNLRPKRTFSPNGDGMNDCWEILNLSQPDRMGETSIMAENMHMLINTQGCKIYIFDARGRNIKVVDAPFKDNCVWDGNSNGSPAPEGVYYFVFKCDNSELSKSGSILLAR